MTPFFTRERFGSPQLIAALLLLVFFLQCIWLAQRSLSPSSLAPHKQHYIAEGLRQWRGEGIAGTPFPSPSSAPPYLQRDGYDVNRSPLWYLMAAALSFFWPSGTAAPTLSPWFSRAPYLIMGLLLGASLWYVSRRLFGNSGGYIALTLYCFSPGMIITSVGGNFVEPEIGPVWGAFGAIFTAIAVAHTLYAPREVVLWNWRRIVLLGLSLALGIGSQFSLAVLVPLTLGFMLWVAPTRRGAALAIWAAALLVGLVLLWMSYFFHAGVMWQGLRHAEFLRFSPQAFASAGVYKQVGSVILNCSPPLVIALPAALFTYVAWPRARYFGNSAPLLVALLFVLLGMGNPYFSGSAFFLVTVVFLFVVVAGVFADLLETRHRILVIAGLWGLLAAAAVWNVTEVARI